MRALNCSQNAAQFIMFQSNVGTSNLGSLTPKTLAEVMPGDWSNCNHFSLRLKLNKDSLILFVPSNSVVSSPSSNNSPQVMLTSSYNLNSLMLSAKCCARHKLKLRPGASKPILSLTNCNSLPRDPGHFLRGLEDFATEGVATFSSPTLTVSRRLIRSVLSSWSSNLACSSNNTFSPSSTKSMRAKMISPEVCV